MAEPEDPASSCLFALVLFAPSTTWVVIVPLAGANIQKRGEYAIPSPLI